MKKSIKLGFISWTENYRSGNVLPWASVREGSKFFSLGLIGQKEKKKKIIKGTLRQIDKIG